MTDNVAAFHMNEIDRLNEVIRELSWALRLCQVAVFMHQGSENEAYRAATNALNKMIYPPIER